MKKTQIKDALRNIWKKKISFISICFIVFLGVGCFLWVGFVRAAFDSTATEYMTAQKYADLELVSSLGITESNLEKINADENVLVAEGVLQTTGKIGHGGTVSKVDLLTATEKVNIARVEEGRMPAGERECAVDVYFAESKGINIGDTVTLSEDNNVLKSSEFTVVGFVTHPSFIRSKKTPFVLLQKDAVDTDATSGLYSKAVVLLNLPDEVGMFSKTYFKDTEKYERALAELTKLLGDERDAEVRKEGGDKIADAKAELSEKVADAERQIADGEKELSDKLAEGEKKLADAKKKIEDGEKQIADVERQIKDGELELEAKEFEGRQALEDAEKQIQAGWLEYYDGEAKLRAAIEELDIADFKICITIAEVDEALAIAEKISEKKDQIKEILHYYIGDNVAADIFFETWDNLETAYYEYKDAVMEAYRPVIEAELNQISSMTVGQMADQAIEAAKQHLMDNTYVGTILSWADEYILNDEDHEKFNEIKNTVFGYMENIAKATAAKPLLKVAQQLIEDSSEQIEAGKKALEDAKKQLLDAEQLLEEKREEGEMALEDAKQQIEDGKKQLEDGRAELEKGKKEYQNGLKEFEDGKREGEQKIADAKAELAEKKADAEKQIAEAEQKLAELPACGWIIQNRKTNYGYLDVSSMINEFKIISVAFASLFLVIVALVCFSTMAIIVGEQKKLVGATKAFGFFGSEVFGKYAIFGLTATVIGLVGGIVAAYFAEGLILSGIGEAYSFGRMGSVIDVPTTVIVCAAVVALSLVTTLLSCRHVLKKPASALMNGSDDTLKKHHRASAHAPGSVFARLVRRNMMSELPRVIVSIVIVIGCICIIGAGFTLTKAYSGISAKQFSDVKKYDYKLTYRASDDEGAEALESILKESGVSYVSVSENGHPLVVKGTNESTFIVSADGDEIRDFLGVNDDVTGKPIELSPDGIAIQGSLAERYGLKVGDTITVYDLSLITHEVTITGIFRNYYGRTAVMSKAARDAILGGGDNCFYVKLGGVGEESFVKAINESGVEVSVERGDAELDSVKTFSNILNVSMYGLTFMAILMMFIILTNLTNIFVNKRLKDIAIMRINGFSHSETIRFLMRETVMTNAIGIVAGLLIGSNVGYLIVRMMEQLEIRFVRTFSFSSWGIAIGLTALSAVAISAISFRKIKKLSLTDAK